MVHYSTGPFSESSIENYKPVFAYVEITCGKNCCNEISGMNEVDEGSSPLAKMEDFVQKVYGESHILRSIGGSDACVSQKRTQC